MNIDKGEIVYCNLKVQYNKKNKLYQKTLLKTIFARPYDCETYPNLDIVKYSMLINKIDKKNGYYIDSVKVVDLDILVRTGYIAKFKK
tara:strand:- start:171 stop:434 length:264 start_codon:yes stop_codon:yes gene_type:complete